MSSYNFLPIAGAVVALYIVSWLLARSGRLSVLLHRKAWNAVLLSSFVGTIVFSLLNVLAYDTGISVLPAFINVTFWHVEFGIICVLVALFHALWHIPYFKQYLPKEKLKPAVPAAAPAQPAAPQQEKKE
jgi:threonine/homoserine/homoserine lactone efflux protein